MNINPWRERRRLLGLAASLGAGGAVGELGPSRLGFVDTSLDYQSLGAIGVGLWLAHAAPEMPVWKRWLVPVGGFAACLASYAARDVDAVDPVQAATWARVALETVTTFMVGTATRRWWSGADPDGSHAVIGPRREPTAVLPYGARVDGPRDYFPEDGWPLSSRVIR